MPGAAGAPPEAVARGRPGGRSTSSKKTSTSDFCRTKHSKHQPQSAHTHLELACCDCSLLLNRSVLGPASLHQVCERHASLHRPTHIVRQNVQCPVCLRNTRPPDNTPHMRVQANKRPQPQHTLARAPKPFRYAQNQGKGRKGTTRSHTLVSPTNPNAQSTVHPKPSITPKPRPTCATSNNW